MAVGKDLLVLLEVGQEVQHKVEVLPVDEVDQEAQHTAIEVVLAVPKVSGIIVGRIVLHVGTEVNQAVPQGVFLRVQHIVIEAAQRVQPVKGVGPTVQQEANTAAGLIALLAVTEVTVKKLPLVRLPLSTGNLKFKVILLHDQNGNV